MAGQVYPIVICKIQTPTEHQSEIQTWVITNLHKKCASKMNTQACPRPTVYPGLTVENPEDQVPEGITIPDYIPLVS